MRYFFIFILALSCASREEKEQKLSEISPKRAVSDLHSSKNKNLKGNISIEEKGGGLIFKADVKGLKPNAKHGFHIHEKGICEGPDYKSAGAHLNPHKTKHGDPKSSHKHLGDLGNIQTDQTGSSKTVITIENVTLDEISGKSVLIHESMDDLKTDPSGNSGGRIACGLIKPVE